MCYREPRVLLIFEPIGGKPMKKFLLILVALALLLAACGDGDDAEGETTTTVAAAGTTETTAADETTTTAAETTTTTVAETTTTTVAETTTTTTGASDPSESPLLAALSGSGDLEATSFRMEGEMTMLGVNPDDPLAEFSITFSGAFAENGDNSLVMDMSGIAEAGGDEIPPGFEDLFSELEIRTIGDISYMKFGFFSMLGVTTDWVSMDAEEAGDTAGAFGAAPIDPTEFVDSFDVEGVEIEELGTETVRGVSTTHYRLTVDPEVLAEQAGDDAIEDLEELGALGLDGPLPVEFWVGDDGYLYRMMMDIEGDGLADGSFGALTMIYEMFDYNSAITIDPPPAEDVTDGSELGSFLTG